jgi:hypothetical protein
VEPEERHRGENVANIHCSYPHGINLQEAQRQRTHSAQTHHKPARLVHLLVRNHARRIPGQMPQAIEGVEGEGPADQELGGALHEHGHLGEGSGDHGALEVPAEVGSDEVGGAEGVEAAGEDAAGDAVEGGEVPGDLRAVDGEVRGDGAVETLFGEDSVLGVLLGEGLGGC